MKCVKCETQFSRDLAQQCEGKVEDQKRDEGKGEEVEEQRGKQKKKKGRDEQFERKGEGEIVSFHYQRYKYKSVLFPVLCS